VLAPFPEFVTCRVLHDAKSETWHRACRGNPKSRHGPRAHGVRHHSGTRHEDADMDDNGRSHAARNAALAEPVQRAIINNQKRPDSSESGRRGLARLRGVRFSASRSQSCRPSWLPNGK
jgi:hypothetical protein